MARLSSFSVLRGSLPAARPLWRGAVLCVLALAATLQAAAATPILLVEADTGKVLEQQEAGKPWYPASVTKLMTVYVALTAMRHGRIASDTPIKVSALAAAQEPTKMGFPVGTEVTLENALRMLLVRSSNDMAIVIAEGVGGSVPDFVDEMNAAAQRLGMTGTHYANPNGLPNPEQVTTARDLALLARALIYHFPEQEGLFRIPAIRLGKMVLRNYNRLIDRYPGADGMKTGFICASGFNLVATATRGQKRLIAVILGAPSAVARTEEAALLFEKGFQPSWNIFGNAAPPLESVVNIGGAPTDMSGAICNRKRGVVAAENEDESNPRTAFASTLAGRSGAELLQNLPPSMPPVQVYIGTRRPAAPDTTYAAAPAAPSGTPAPRKPAATATASTAPDAAAPAKKKTVQPAAPATASITAVPKPRTDAAKTDAAKPKPGAATASAAKPAAKPASADASAKPAAAKPAAAKPVATKPVAAKPPAPKPAPKPAAQPAQDDDDSAAPPTRPGT